MAHWDDSGTAVGYEGKKGDKLIRESLCGKKARKKKSKLKKHPEPVKLDVKLKPVEGAILDEGEDLDNLYSVFGVSDETDILDILSGSVGEEEW